MSERPPGDRVRIGCIGSQRWALAEPAADCRAEVAVTDEISTEVEA
jgi:hypothetical protein